MDEPSETAFGVTQIRHKVVFANGGRNATPCPNRKIGARDDGDRFVFVQQIVQFGLITSGKLWRRIWRAFSTPTTAFLAILQFGFGASVLKPDLGLTLLHA